MPFILNSYWFGEPPAPCDLPPYALCNTSVNTYCVQNFNTLTGVLDGFTPRLAYIGGSTVPSESNAEYFDYVSGGSGTDGVFGLLRDSSGGIAGIAIFGGSGYTEEDTIVIPAALIGDTTDVEILLSYTNGLAKVGAWAFCDLLTSFPLLDTGSGIDFSYAWKNCAGLTSFPALDTSSGTIFYESWYGCDSLTTFPPLNTSSGTDFGGAWSQCEGLTSLPLLDTSAGIYFDSAWGQCTGLTSFPLLDTSSGTQFNAAWSYCTSLTSFPLLDTSAGIEFSYAWYNCNSLISFPLLDVSNGTNFSNAWQSCSNLTSFPANMFDSCLATKFYEAWFNCALDETSVDNILVSLDTAGQSNGTVSLDGGTSSPPGSAGGAAKASLIFKGWTVFTN